MRKYRKTELLEVVKTLQSANEIFQKKIKFASAKELIGSLTQCQQGAVRVGECIEQELGVGTVTVNMLEEYCELLYQIAESVSDAQSAEKTLKRTARLLYKIENSIKYDIPEEKKEIVFLPYKASMWDSLESIWMAAKEDENCECYVIPIPYYDRDRDGSLGQLHYEGDQYPDYVPVTTLDAYNIVDRRPDVIYIHNPYDDCNYVTSVHPMFYARELRKHTDCLVYVPYFFTEGELPEGHLQLPAYSYIDVMVVQNASIKEQLKEVLDEKKIAVLGSPKLDRILLYEKKEQIPDNLKEYVGKRKMILLNTSISFLLENSKSAIDKIRLIIDAIKRRRDVILIWRPHPLLEATLKTMRPSLYHNYMILKEQFIQNKEGIFDSGMDLDILVSCVDAYVGETTSSMVVLFKSLGKPVFIISPQYQESALGRSEAFFDFYTNDNKIYFAHSDFNVVCVGDMKTGIVDKVIKMDETAYTPRAYTDICEQNGELFFAPMNEKQLLRIELATNECKTIKLSNPGVANFNRAIKYRKYIYFIPTTYEALIRYDCCDHTVREYTEPVLTFKKNSREDGYITMFAACIAEDKLYLASPISNCVVEFDLEAETTSTYLVGSKDSGYWDMIYDGKDFWFNPYKGTAIVRWNKASNTVSEYDRYPEGFICPEDRKDCFIRIVDCGKTLLAFPKSANMIVEVVKETGELHQFDLRLPYEEGMRKDSRYSWPSNYYFAKKDGKKIYAMSAYDHSLLEIDYEDHTYKTKTFVLSETVAKELGACLFRQDNTWVQAGYLYRESQQGSIQFFLDALVQGKVGTSREEREAFYNNLVNTDGTVGKKVHQYVMEK